MPTKINFKKCSKCGTCIEVCPETVYDEGPDGAPKIARPDECSDCGICVEECPEEAITLI